MMVPKLFSFLFLNLVLMSNLIAEGNRIWFNAPKGEPGEVIELEVYGDFEVPLDSFDITFALEKDVFDFVEATFEGTDLESHKKSQIIAGNEQSGMRTEDSWAIAVNFRQSNNSSPIPPGQSVFLVKMLFKIKPSAPEQVYVLEHQQALMYYRDNLEDFGIMINPPLINSTVEVLPPSGPRPVDELTCSNIHNRAYLQWKNTENDYDHIEVYINDQLSDSLAPSEESFEDNPSPGIYKFTVYGVRDGKRSIASECEVFIDIQRPPTPIEFTCQLNGNEVLLNWNNPTKYDQIELFRNGNSIRTFTETTESFRDQLHSNLFTVYSLRGIVKGTASLSSSCHVNAFNHDYLVRMETVRAQPGETNVPVKVYYSTIETIEGFQIQASMDLTVAKFSNVQSSNLLEFFEYFFFGFNPQNFEEGFVKVGTISKLFQDGSGFSAGIDQHMFTIFVDIHPNAIPGTRIPFVYDEIQTNMSANNSKGPRVIHPVKLTGELLIGSSPVDEVKNIVGETVPLDNKSRKGLNNEGILISWENGADYDEIHVIKNKEEPVIISGDSTLYLDDNPGEGIHTYEIVGVRDQVLSFPQEIKILPKNVPGTFSRGDSNRDSLLDLSDVITNIGYLFYGDLTHTCFDALDIDDNSKLELGDSIFLLVHLYLGGVAPPAPTLTYPWFDPTPDDLTCE